MHTDEYPTAPAGHGRPARRWRPWAVSGLVLAVLLGVGLGTYVLWPAAAPGHPASAPASGSPSPPVEVAPTVAATDAVPSPTPTPSPSPSPSRSAPAKPSPTKPAATRPAPKPASQKPAPVPAASPGAGAPEAQVLAIVNQRRAEAGCGPLHYDDRLATAAAGHSADMAARDYFSHTTPEGGTPWDRAKAAGYDQPSAENIAAGNATAEATMTQWMNSPGHKANILNCSYQALGVGRATGGTYRYYWTQLFGFR